MRNYRTIFFLFRLLFFAVDLTAQPRPVHNLQFTSLATRWDEAIPLGNGWLGALIWQKENKLRLSLDRVDLWDDRLMPEIDKLKFSWVVEKVKRNQYDSVQKTGDEPYEKFPAPTKIPGAAIEFDLDKLGTVISNTLNIETGLSTIRFGNGIILNNYIHATRNTGYFGFENCTLEITPELMIPRYHTGRAGRSDNSREGQGLERLGYPEGRITRYHYGIRYHQPTISGHYYEVLVQWFRPADTRIIGQWTISYDKPATLTKPDFTKAEPTFWTSHSAWWKEYWSRSSVSIPDSLLERQYYLDMYKFACVARSNTPPISLQAIWTADNGNLPPWKGDFHHDLNTQLSYWPGYTGNHLDLTEGFTNWLIKVRKENERWTRQYFEMPGLNVPGVTTISGKEMGGWIQYSMSPTTSAWLSQHFYWQAMYGMDLPAIRQAADYLERTKSFIMAYLGKTYADTSFIPLSSSPEYHNNSIQAWFKTTTNYDKSLIRSLEPSYKKIVSLIPRKVYISPGSHNVIEQLGEYDINETGLTVAAGQNLSSSHRHLSPYMAIYPLCLLDVDNAEDNPVINNSLRHIEQLGTREWCGYTFSWMGCIYARCREADSAVSMLRKFATNFVSINSFHLNGDQKGGQYSNYTYSPFTLEGNFAFAQGIHELLVQTRNGVIEVFPATPKTWETVSFQTLRTEGAFLVSAKKENRVIAEVRIKSTAGGMLRIKFPFKTWRVEGVRRDQVKIQNEIAEIKTSKGQTIIFKNEYE